MDVRYKYFDNVDIEELVTFNNEKQTLQNALLSIKIGAKALFKGIEQGLNKNRKKVHILMSPKMWLEAQQWLRINKQLIIKENSSLFECSIKPVSTSMHLYDAKLNEFVTASFEHQNSIKINNFDKKYSLFAATLSNKQNSNKNDKE